MVKLFFSKLRQHMKWIIILVCAAFALTLLYVGGSGLISRPPEVEAVARVNGRPIDALELQQAFAQTVNLYRQFGQTITRLQEEDVRFNILMQLVDYELMLQAARRERVKPDEDAINEQINQLKSTYGATAFRDLLRQQGLTERDLREMLRDDSLVNEIQKQKSAVTVTDEDVRRAYDESLIELKTRHILFEPETSADGALDWDAALAQAEAARERILAGEDFAVVARELSDDEGTREDGGDLGWIDRDYPLVPEFMDALFRLEVGTVSEPVRTAFGYHLIQATERRTVEPEKSFEEAKEELRQQIETERGNRLFQEWLQNERAAADVTILDPQLRAHQLLRNNLVDQAIAQYREALALRPNDPYLYFRLAVALETVGAGDEAIESYKKAAELGRTDPQLWFALGQAYEERGEKEAAKDAYVLASDYSPTNLTVHQLLEQVFTDLGYPELAEAERAKAEEIQALIAEQQRRLEEEAARRAELEAQVESARRGDQAQQGEEQESGAAGGTETPPATGE